MRTDLYLTPFTVTVDLNLGAWEGHSLTVSFSGRGRDALCACSCKWFLKNNISGTLGYPKKEENVKKK